MHKRRHWAGHNLTLITTGTKRINVLLVFNVGAMSEPARSAAVLGNSTPQLSADTCSGSALVSPLGFTLG